MDFMRFHITPCKRMYGSRNDDPDLDTQRPARDSRLSDVPVLSLIYFYSITKIL